MHSKLLNLTELLVEANLLTEAQSVFELPNQADNINKWLAVRNELSSPIPDQIKTTIQYIKQNINEMIKNKKQIEHLSQDDLKMLVEMTVFAQQHKAYQVNYILKTGQAELFKNIWQGTKYLGKKTLHLIPLVGFVFSFLLALKNFTYSLTSFAKLIKDSNQINLTWLEVLSPNKLKEKTLIFKENPDKMLILTRLTKYSKEFYNETISLITNGLDFIKDIIFLFLDIGSFGWMTVGDISLSVVFMVLEYLGQSASETQFELILNEINRYVVLHLQFTKNNITSMTPEELNQWFLKN